VAAVGVWLPAAAVEAPPQLHEIVVIADQQADAAMTVKVATALRDDPFLFSDHVNVTSENGVVRLEGIVRDLPDLLQILRLARRIAGKGRVVNKIDFVPTDVDGN
jgi:osmotically-inducible protein OsmY